MSISSAERTLFSLASAWTRDREFTSYAPLTDYQLLTAVSSSSVRHRAALSWRLICSSCLGSRVRFVRRLPARADPASPASPEGDSPMRLRNLVSDTAVYGSARVVSSLAGALLIPLYVRRLSVSDYGAVENINVFLALAPPLIGVSLYQGIYRFCSPQAPNRAEALGAILVASVWSMAVSCLPFHFLAPTMAETFFGRRGVEFVWSLFLLGSLLAVNTVIQTWLNVEMRKGAYVACTLGATILQLTFAIWFVGVARFGVSGFVAAALIAQLTALGIGLFAIRGHLAFSNSLRRAWPILAYSAAFIPGSLAVLAMRSSDRYILSIVNGGDLREIGLYAMAEKMALPVALLGAAFSQAFPAFGLRLAAGAANKRVLQDIFRLYVVLTAVVSFVCSALALPFLKVIGATAFFPAAQYTPFLTIYLSLNSLVTIGSLAVYVSGKPLAVVSASIAAAVVNLLVNLLLIPQYGVWGAVWATVLAFIVYNVVVFGMSERDLPMNYPFSAAALTYAASLIAGMVALTGASGVLLGGAAFALVLSMTRLATLDDLRRLISLLRPSPSGTA